MMKKLLFCFGLISLFTGCLKNTGSEQKCTYDPCGAKAPSSEIQALKDTLANHGITATEHCSGLFYAIEEQGTGVAPTACSIVTVKYKGTLPNGTVFDQTATDKTYTNYLSSLIRGWINGIPLIKTGGKIHLYIPPSLGYGNQQAGTIPANSILFFDVELVAVQ
ncbi:FKBP-type peptidyl-prolyl cis-trans isomerase [Chitinophagaceae bacterium LB-8]|uniref:Peptidyl-prolyl cis-trans isomerase n=1 Tax=Paraflavisolibacter caeni TaxID=2982496 RepID=A0A9X2XV05_9BACT|nr:FKBP-type peptidyl-prolyl cis-trans isomerase [Paraflavisolibacter caeni]MCU7549175.1 FKBP-type peptidyl-prolyl cis-trans isomerase [Paraflavisolibacter caeni]